MNDSPAWPWQRMIRCYLVRWRSIGLARDGWHSSGSCWPLSPVMEPTADWILPSASLAAASILVDMVLRGLGSGAGGDRPCHCRWLRWVEPADQLSRFFSRAMAWLSPTQESEQQTADPQPAGAAAIAMAANLSAHGPCGAVKRCIHSPLSLLGTAHLLFPAAG